MILLQVNGLTKSFGDRILFSDLSFGISEGERIGLIAPNGTGKTTLLNIITGGEDYDSGDVVFRNGVRVGYLPQEPSYPAHLTVIEACFTGDSELLEVIKGYESAIENNASADQMQDWLTRMDHLKGWDYEQRMKQVLSQLKIDDINQKIGELSGGQLKRVALANVLISEPEIIVLDEPTNHLDLEMTEWLENYLNRSRVALLMVTHDRYFLDRVCNEIIEIDSRRLYAYQGNYSYYLEKREERVMAQGAEMDKAKNLYRKELEWMRRQPQARATKAKARKESFYGLEKQVKQDSSSGNILLQNRNTYIGNKIFEIQNLNKSFDEKVILNNFSYTFSRYEKMGIIGNNGTGKSTFIKLLLGVAEPDNGLIDIGQTINFGYYSQEGLKFDDQKRVIDVIQDIAEYIEWNNGTRISASQLLQHFLFTPETQYGLVHKLSGGEKRRLYLCSILMKNPNFLVLDEPTNDLDIVTLNILEEYLTSFSGCVIVVSHDRFFMDKIVDHLMVFEGNGKIKDFPGNYSDYRLWRDEELSAENAKTKTPTKQQEKQADKPALVVSRKLTFNEKRELEEINTALPQLENRKKELENQLNSASLSSDELVLCSNKIAEIIDAIDEKTMRWLELSC